tara:strand:- start:873 stop:1133 length:261 start_codon:yes stop_codon:yes gene_type:complete
LCAAGDAPFFAAPAGDLRCRAAVAGEAFRFAAAAAAGERLAGDLRAGDLRARAGEGVRVFFAPAALTFAFAGEALFARAPFACGLA